MSIHKQKNGYIVRVRVGDKHLSRTVKTLSEAKKVEYTLMNQSSYDYDSADLLTLVELWFNLFGIHLKDAKRRYSKLLFIIDKIGNLKLNKLYQGHFFDFRNERLSAGISPNTCNHDLAYFKTVFNKLLKAGYISVNPIKNIAPLRLEEKPLTFLTRYELRRLLLACRQSSNESLLPVSLLCVRTGARWSEAEKLVHSQLANNSVTFIRTKNGKNRTVPLHPDFYQYLSSRHKLPDGRIFANCSSAFRHAVERAKLTLPQGQMTHILRHTYASHFMMNGGDILTLQKLLGHSDLKITMRYAHLSPEYMRNALNYLVI